MINKTCFLLTKEKIKSRQFQNFEFMNIIKLIKSKIKILLNNINKIRYF